MNHFHDMTHTEQINFAVGNLALAIGEGKFRDAVASLIGATHALGYLEGKKIARQEGLNRHANTIGVVFKIVAEHLANNPVLLNVIDADTCCEIIEVAKVFGDSP